MHLLLTDRLTCPRCGPSFGLILLADRMNDRRVVDGVLGCPNCRDGFPVRDGFGDLRAGWLIGSAEYVERSKYVMDLLSVNNAAPVAPLALCALAQLTSLEERYRRCHAQGQAVFREWLKNQMPAPASPPSTIDNRQSAIRVYPNHGCLFECLKLPDGVAGDRFCDLLASKYETRVVPGRFFDLPDHIRLTTAVPPDDLAEALSRIGRALNDLLTI